MEAVMNLPVVNIEDEEDDFEGFLRKLQEMAFHEVSSPEGKAILSQMSSYIEKSQEADNINILELRRENKILQQIAGDISDSNESELLTEMIGKLDKYLKNNSSITKALGTRVSDAIRGESRDSDGGVREMITSRMTSFMMNRVSSLPPLWSSLANLGIDAYKARNERRESVRNKIANNVTNSSDEYADNVTDSLERIENSLIKSENNNFSEVTSNQAEREENYQKETVNFYDDISNDLSRIANNMQRSENIKNNEGNNSSNNIIDKIFNFGKNSLVKVGASLGLGTVAKNVLTKNPVTKMIAKTGAGKALSKVAEKGLGIKFAEKGLVDTGENVAEKGLVKTAEKGLMKTGGKGLLKAGGKSILKKIPGLSILAGGAFALNKFLGGDVTGGLMELASGVAGTIPLIGTVVSAGIDAASAVRDMNMEEENQITNQISNMNNSSELERDSEELRNQNTEIIQSRDELERRNAELIKTGTDIDRNNNVQSSSSSYIKSNTNNFTEQYDTSSLKDNTELVENNTSVPVPQNNVFTDMTKEDIENELYNRRLVSEHDRLYMRNNAMSSGVYNPTEIMTEQRHEVRAFTPITNSSIDTMNNNSNEETSREKPSLMSRILSTLFPSATAFMAGKMFIEEKANRNVPTGDEMILQEQGTRKSVAKTNVLTTGSMINNQTETKNQPVVVNKLTTNNVYGGSSNEPYPNLSNPVNPFIWQGSGWAGAR